MNFRFARLISLVALAALITVNTSPSVTLAQGGLLAKVKERGKLLCGVNPGILGFGFLDTADNTFKGFDPDFCRVVAAAILGDATKVEFVPIAATADRFPSLRAGTIDILIRNTTFTAGRDTAEKAEFMPTTFYDASSVLVRAEDGYKTLDDLKDLTVCAINNTTNAQAISEIMSQKGLAFTLTTFENVDGVFEAFTSGRCDAVTSDRSQLTGRRAGANKTPTDWLIFEDNLTKEPLGPAILEGDAEWSNAIRWAIYATFILEEKGITQANVDDMVAKSADPETKRLLGVDGELYKSLGLDAKWAYNIAKQVGNYGEIFERNLGENTVLKMPRGLNGLWTNGGLIYAPPYR